MADNLTTRQRSDAMRRVKSSNTTPELVVRALLREAGFRGYRLHRKDIVGRPDIAWVGRRIAIFVHGCFWHGHDCERGARRPKQNAAYWAAKVERNRSRDIRGVRLLRREGWRVLVLWECALKKRGAVAARLRRFLGQEVVGSPSPRP